MFADNWNWVMDWSDVIAPQIMSDLLEKSFFPRWLQVLTMWLNMSPNYDQVTEWYSRWKSLVPLHLREQQKIKGKISFITSYIGECRIKLKMRPTKFMHINGSTQDYST